MLWSNDFKQSLSILPLDQLHCHPFKVHDFLTSQDNDWNYELLHHIGDNIMCSHIFLESLPILDTQDLWF